MRRESLLFFLPLFTEVLGALWRIYAMGLPPYQGGDKIVKK
jgi:hypothetical protein